MSSVLVGQLAVPDATAVAYAQPGWIQPRRRVESTPLEGTFSNVAGDGVTLNLLCDRGSIGSVAAKAYDRNGEMGAGVAQPWEVLIRWVEDLASTDENVRDGTALSGLGDALLGEDAVDDETARGLDDYALRAGGPLGDVGAPEGEVGIFGRSFTLELLAVLHHRENGSPFLGAERKERGLRAWQRVVEEENDFRSRVEGMGWAHVVAHAADLADELIGDPAASPAAQRNVLEGLSILVERSPRVYDAEEEDRLANTLATAVARREEALREIVALVRRGAAEPFPDVVRQNWKAVVRSAYFRVGSEAVTATRVLYGLEAELVRL